MIAPPTARLSTACVLAALVFLVVPPTLAQAPGGAETAHTAGNAPPTAVANGNVTPAGVLRGGVLSLHLVAQQARWHPEADDGPALDVEAFGEEGKQPSTPGPLIRVRTGTRVETSIRNALNISVEDDAELTLRSEASSDTSVVSWRAIAKDGADLHREHAVRRPAVLTIAPGETYDYEVTLPAGDYRLRMKSFKDLDVVLRVR